MTLSTRIARLRQLANEAQERRDYELAFALRLRVRAMARTLSRHS